MSEGKGGEETPPHYEKIYEHFSGMCVCVLVCVCWCVLLMMVYRMSTTAQAQEVPGNRMAQGPEQATQLNATQHNVT